ncbi:MAG TPA: hypothetical protein VGP25_16430 [Gemmatimonadaceae bacterium]|jgi:hypothetical protein|nr:hypothetical protein [Gemmatimonadaceae bacterium]
MRDVASMHCEAEIRSSHPGLAPDRKRPMKISKRVRVLAVILGSGIVVASSACGTDVTAPTPAVPLTTSQTTEARSRFVPSEASKALIGVTDGVYSVTFNPAVDQVFALGPNRLEIPANAVCNLTTSGYGSAYWNRPCSPETKPVTLVVTVKNASSSNPQVDFQPAMRFNPNTTVSLYFYVRDVSKKKAKDWTILYCPVLTTSGKDSNGCVNEAFTDRDLTSYVDFKASVLFRRIKHFSAYKVTDNGGYFGTE